MAQELHKEVNKAIEAIPGASAVRRTRSARPRPSYQRPQATATRPSPASSAETRQSTPVSRSAQARTATPARTIRERPAPMRIADTPRTSERAVPTPVRWEPEPPTAPSAPRPPSRPVPTPLSIKDTHMPAEPDIAAPAPREPEPQPTPSVPPAPSPVTASVPEPVVAVPAPSVPEPAATPSEVQLDVASVCEDLFDPNRMSYETNRLFDDRYKDVTVRWKGTARRAKPILVRFHVWGRRRNEGRVGCLRGEAAVRQPHGQGIRAAARRGRRRYWRSHRRGRAVRRPSPSPAKAPRDACTLPTPAWWTEPQHTRRVA